MSAKIHAWLDHMVDRLLIGVEGTDPMNPDLTDDQELWM